MPLYSSPLEGVIGEASRLDETDIASLGAEAQDLVSYLDVSQVDRADEETIFNICTLYRNAIDSIECLSRPNKALEGFHGFLIEVLEENTEEK